VTDGGISLIGLDWLYGRVAGCCPEPGDPSGRPPPGNGRGGLFVRCRAYCFIDSLIK
jgi:hypothetical protein